MDSLSHHTPGHWASMAKRPDEVLIDQQGIIALGKDAFANDPNLTDLAAYPDELSGAQISAAILSISKPHKSDLYYQHGGRLEASDYETYKTSLNLAALSDRVAVRFALVVERANMRTWPTEDVVFKSQQTIDLDRFQENGLFPADTVAVLHQSKDGLWYFVQSFNYAAWVRKDGVAIGQRPEILAYKSMTDFLIVTGSKVNTLFNAHAATVSELQLDMGIRLPLPDLDNTADSENPDTGYAVRLPVSEENGVLGFRTAHIARDQDVHRGYLPFTRRNIVEQAFKFLGERYGWGHSYNARDCTGLVSEVYKTFGIQLPRNSGQQGNSPIGDSIEFAAEISAEEKLSAVMSADVGDLLYSTGHVMIYLGAVDSMPYVIHDLSGFGWAGEDGQVREAVLNGVSLTPLLTLHSSRDTTYFEEIYAIKRIR